MGVPTKRGNVHNGLSETPIFARAQIGLFRPKLKGTINMYAQKLIVTTDNFGNLKVMPKLPANKQIEAIFLVLEDDEISHSKRQPHPDIVGRVQIVGDIIDTVTQAEWNVPE